MNCCVSPSGTEGVAGVTLIDTIVAAVTVNGVAPEMCVVGSLAVMVVAPTDAVVASPFDPPALEMLATAPADELHVTVDVRSCVVELLYVPVAVNCRVRPSGTLVDAGVTAIETSCAAVTVSVAEPEMFVAGSRAVMVVVPITPAVATPSEPLAFETEAMAGVVDDHVTAVVRTWVDAFVYVPMAVYCTVNPLGTDCVVGVTAIETSRAEVTARVVEPAMPDPGSVALIVVVPVPSAVASPRVAAAFDTDATEPLEEAHVTLAVTSWVVAFVYVPMAVNCVVVPSGMDGSAGVTAIDTSCAEVTVSVVDPEIPLAASVALITVVPSATAVASPAEADAFEMEAVVGADDSHVTDAVRSWVVPSV